MGKTSQVLRCDWLPEWASWSYLACSGLPAMSRKENFPKSPIIIIFYWPSLFGQDGLILALFFFVSLQTSTPSQSINLQKKKNSYPAILTSHLVNNPYIRLSTTKCIIFLVVNFLLSYNIKRKKKKISTETVLHVRI